MLFFFCALFFAEPFCDRGVLWYRDLGLFSYPLHHAMAAILKSFQAPFLLPGLNGGQPLLANPTFQLFYPATVLYLLLPVEVAFDLILSGHLLFAALGFYWFLRGMRFRWAAALAGSVIFAFGGPMVSGLASYNFVLAFAWLPWILGLARRSFQNAGCSTPLCAVAVALQLLTGAPSVQLLTALVVAAGWVAVGVRERDLRLARGCSIALLALALASVQLVPTLRWLPHSSRGEGIDFDRSAAWWSLHPARLVEFVAPGYLGDPLALRRDGFFGDEYSDSGLPYLPRIQLGWLAILLLPFALKNRVGRVGGLLLLAGALLAMGRHLPGYRGLYALLPPLHLVRYPEKFLQAALLGSALVVASGVDGLLSGKRARGGIAFGGVVLVAFLIFSLVVPLGGPTASQRMLQLAAARRSLLAGGLLLLLIALARRMPRIVSVALPLTLFVELATPSLALLDHVDARLLHEMPRLLNADQSLRQGAVLHLGEEQLDRYGRSLLLPRRAMYELLHPLTGLTAGVSYAGAADIDRLGWQRSSGRRKAIYRALREPGAGSNLVRLGVSHVVSLLPLHVDGLQDEAAIVDAPYLEGYVYRAAGDCAALMCLEGRPLRADAVASQPSRIAIHLSAETSGRLVVKRNALPGWSARIDDTPASILPTPEGWLSLQLPQGAHEVSFRYLPPGLLTGLLLTVLGLLWGVVLLARARTATHT